MSLKEIGTMIAQAWFEANRAMVTEMVAAHNASAPRLIGPAIAGDSSSMKYRLLVSPNHEMSLLDLYALGDEFDAGWPDRLVVTTGGFAFGSHRDPLESRYEDGAGLAAPEREEAHPAVLNYLRAYYSSAKMEEGDQPNESELAVEALCLQGIAARLSAALARLEQLTSSIDLAALAQDAMRRDALLCNIVRFAEAVIDLTNLRCMEPWDAEINPWWSLRARPMVCAPDDIDWILAWNTAKRDAPMFYARIREAVGW